jgi:outer membrane protein TolC
MRREKMNKTKQLLFIFIFLFSMPLFANENHAERNATLTFAQAAELAIISSPELRQSRSLHALKEGAWMWGLREYFPNINISVSENDRLQIAGADSFIKNYGISLDQLLWDGGKTSMSRKLERMELNLSSSELERMALNIADQAISTYRSVLSSREILDIRKTALSVLEEQRRILNEEVMLGLALPVDLANADINLASAKIDIISLQMDIAEMERQFADFLGLEKLPLLVEKIDINRSIVLPASSIAQALAREKNPELVQARYAITKRQAELKYVSNSWIPNFRFTGNFALTGQNYPLTRYNWSFGLTVDFTSPWFNNRFGVQTGWEPSFPAEGLYDRTASVQNNISPLADPTSVFTKRQATLALAFERENYNTILDNIGRVASNALEKYSFTEQKRVLARQTAALGVERCRIEEIRLELGQITRLELMETLIEQTQREIAVVEAAIALLEAERELERFLDLKPGGLAEITQQRSDL